VSVDSVQREQPTVRAILRVVVTVVLSVLALYVVYLAHTPIGYVLLGAFVAVAASGPGTCCRASCRAAWRSRSSTWASSSSRSSSR
jgi:hypothetical protein